MSGRAEASASRRATSVKFTTIISTYLAGSALVSSVTEATSSLVSLQNALFSTAQNLQSQYPNSSVSNATASVATVTNDRSSYLIVFIFVVVSCMTVLGCFCFVGTILYPKKERRLGAAMDRDDDELPGGHLPNIRLDDDSLETSIKMYGIEKKEST